MKNNNLKNHCLFRMHILVQLYKFISINFYSFNNFIIFMKFKQIHKYCFQFSHKSVTLKITK